MRILSIALAKLRAIFRRNGVADEIRDEMRFHVEMRAEEYQQQGLRPDEARRRASKQFGNLAVMQDRGYDVRGGGMFEMLWRDARYGSRALKRQPIVTGAVVLTLAIAIAANTALFSIFDGLLFRPLPYRSPETIVHIQLPSSSQITTAESNALRERLQTTPLLVEGARAEWGPVFEEGVRTVTEWGLAPVFPTPSFFELFGVQPRIGRAFTDEDDARDGPRPLILGHALWRTRFGGDPDIINRVIDIPGTINNRPWLVVGVMPEGFDFPSGANLWAVSARQPGMPITPQFARIADGATIDVVRQQFPAVTITPLREHLRPRGAMAFAFLLGATGLLLVVAWVQIAALLFSRAIERVREIGVRLAIGASHGHLIRQFGTEALLVAGAALALGWLLAGPLIAFIVYLLPVEITVGQRLDPDTRTLLFTCVLSAIGVLLLTLLPAGLVRRTSTSDLLRSGMTGRTRTSVARVRGVLTMTQIAVTALLLYAAGLAAHSFSSVSAAPLGFDPSRLVAVRLPYTTVRFHTPVPGEPRVADRADLERQVRLQYEVVDAIRSVPGVLHATAAEHPLEIDPRQARTQIVVTSPASPDLRIDARMSYVRAGFTQALGIPVLEGRDATLVELGHRSGLRPGHPAHGAEATELVVLVNQTLARMLESFGAVPDQVIAMGNDTYRILGVVGDIVQGRPDEPRQPQVFVPAPTVPFVIARLAAGATDAEAGIQATLDRLWADRASRQIIRMEDEHARATADYRARSLLLTLLALLCLPIAIVGLIAAQMDAVRQQTREIAIRLALGAEPADVRRRVVLRAVAVIAAGLTAGLAGGIGVGRLMSSYLYGVEALDPLSVGLVAALLIGVGCLAALWPANRAARIAPATVLRDQ